jgi:glycosyltransferase 2 family protein
LSKQLKLLVSVALLGWLAWCADWSRIGHIFLHLRLELWLAAVLLYLATQFVSALRWRIFAAPLGFEESIRRCAAYYFIGMYFNLFLPTSIGGDLVRAWYLDSKSGRRLPAFLSVFVDRFSGLLVLLALACGAALLCPVQLEPWVKGSVWASAACAGLGLLALPILARFTIRFERIQRLLAGIRLYGDRPRLILATTFLSLIVQAANVILVWLVGLAIGADVPAGYYWILVPMVTLLTLLPSVNGIGIREGGVLLFLKPLGVDQPTALTLSFLWFAVFTATSLLGAGIYLFGNFSRPEERPDDESLGDHPDQGRTRQLKAA